MSRTTVTCTGNPDVSSDTLRDLHEAMAESGWEGDIEMDVRFVRPGVRQSTVQSLRPDEVQSIRRRTSTFRERREQRMEIERRGGEEMNVTDVDTTDVNTIYADFLAFLNNREASAKCCICHVKRPNIKFSCCNNTACVNCWDKHVQAQMENTGSALLCDFFSGRLNLSHVQRLSEEAKERLRSMNLVSCMFCRAAWAAPVDV